MTEPDIAKRRARRRLMGSVALAMVAAIVLPMVLDTEPKPLADNVAVTIPSQDSVFVSKPPGADAKSDGKAAAKSDSKAAGNADGKGVSSQSVEAKSDVPKADASKADAAKATDAAKAASEARAAAEAKAAEAKAAADAKAAQAKAAAKANEKTTEKADDKAAEKAANDKARREEEARVKALLEGEKTAKADKGADKAAADAGGAYVVQVAALTATDKVDEMRKSLTASGITSYTEKTATAQGERTRVRVGPFATREAADKMRDRIRALGFESAVSVPK